LSLTSVDNAKDRLFQQRDILPSRSKHKLREKAHKEEENFNNIVEKYKSKLFGDDTKQLKASRWFQ
ncbi:hypothetical protein, partial [Salmonella sp. s51933]|uniref:hypothetical protein n=1 Tax=Salmonella sp. s51933 TaxID=3160127 RepID=UPI003754E78D